MSIFSSIRRSRQSAKDHNAKLAEQKKKESTSQPYRHVPTHAASDAFASAPPSWREQDRPRIVEQNRRRSAMAASGLHMNMPPIPRVGSSLSHVSYPSDIDMPMPRIPRTYSYNSASPYMMARGSRDVSQNVSQNVSRDVVYSIPDLTEPNPGPVKGKDVSHNDIQRISPTSSKGEHSPVGSSNESTSSQDGLEMKTSRRRDSAGATTHRLHPSHQRRASDSSVRSPSQGSLPYDFDSSGRTGPVSRGSTARDNRPPPSTRGFSFINTPIPPVPPIPATLSLSLTKTSRAAEASHKAGNHLSRPPIPPHDSSTASFSFIQASTIEASRNEYMPVFAPHMQPEESAFPLASNATYIRPSPSDENVNILNTNALLQPKDQRAPKATRFTELERIESQAEPPHLQVPLGSNHQPRPPAHEDVFEVFSEKATPTESVTSVKSKKNKLSKGGGKLMKKNRSAVAV